MKHDDAASNPMFDLPSEVTKSAAIEPARDMDIDMRRSTRATDVSGLGIKRLDGAADVTDLTIVHSESFAGTLAPTQDYQPRQEMSSDDYQLWTLPVVNHFLPSPNRLLIFGSLGLVSALGLGAVASTFLTYRTTVGARATVEPTGEIQTVQTNASGTVETILVKNYEILESNQIIASLDKSSLLTEISNIKARIDQTEEQIVLVSNEIASLEQGRLLDNSRKSALGASSAKIFNYSKGLLQDHRSSLAAQLSRQRAQLAEIEKKIDQLSVLTPTEGTLYDLALAYSGQTVSTNETIAKIIPEGTTLEIKAVVPENQIKHVEVGYSTRITLSTCRGLGAKPIEGEVSAIAPIDQTLSSSFIDTDAIAQSSGGYLVTVEAKSPDIQAGSAGSSGCKLLPGATGEVTIMAKQEKLLDLFLRKLRLKINA
ncbi:HlyD family secretion protein [Leptothoe sp. PORK10 BA2]|uniref:HlyD family secretion protein n=1 Tax=Leptothoe sp. PORK10 BA2 TaxID=3110254 RepID=UPI002B1ED328|nr:HlyD family efflux transporter periplasmic adaptor subunit [Leptothoe sp. PORK10 BA2]MEA5465328.1 HlyD family efflux transporter periplasmic adaptor subunit [Leptothoe sp. PORK10 BA2]